jgi:hypothetical protein
VIDCPAGASCRQPGIDRFVIALDIATPIITVLKQAAVLDELRRPAQAVAG